MVPVEGAVLVKISTDKPFQWFFFTFSFTLWGKRVEEKRGGGGGVLIK